MLNAIITVALTFASFSLTTTDLSVSDNPNYKAQRTINFNTTSNAVLTYQDGSHTYVASLSTEYTFNFRLYYNYDRLNPILPVVYDYNVYLDNIYTRNKYNLYSIANGNANLIYTDTRNYGTDVYEWLSRDGDRVDEIVFGAYAEQIVENDNFKIGVYFQYNTINNSLYEDWARPVLYIPGYDYTTGDCVFTANRYVIDCNTIFNQAFEYANADRYKDGYQDGETAGYNKGYQEGVESASEFSIPALINSIFNAPVAILGGMLDFEILGINIKNLVFFLLTVGIIAWIVSVFKGGKK